MNNRVDIAAIAAACAITKRAAERRANRERWPFEERPARGGRKRYYDIAMLPADVQAALAAKVVAAASANPPSSSSNAGATFSSAGCDDRAPGTSGSAPADSAGPRTSQRAETLAAHFDAKPESVKAEARERLGIVHEYHALLARGFDRAAVTAAVTRERQISEATLSRYLSMVRGKPEHEWLFELCPAYTGRTACAEMSAEAWEVLKADYLRSSPKPPTARACINRLRADPRAAGWTVPSTRTLLRRLNTIPRAVRVLAREGREAASKLYPSQVRARQALNALDIVNGDGYQHKFLWVQFEDGEIRRARTWVWQDVYSSKFLSFRVDKTEHTDLIRLSFMDLVRTYGIPRVGRSVLVDNTRAAANKTMSGGVPHRFRFKVREEEPDGIFKLLGCDLIWATPAHGQAKPVERGFGIGGIGEYVDKAPEFAGCGDDKDAYDGKSKTVHVRDLERVIAREIAFLNGLLGRRSPLHKGRSFDEVFAESYAKTAVRRATEEQLRLLMLASEPVKVQRDGTITLDAGRMVGEHRANRYWNKDLLDYRGKLVAARFDPARLHEGVHIYTADGRYIGFGECLDPAGFDDQAAARDWNRNRAAFLRATREAAEAERRMSVREMVKGREQARNLGGAADSTIPAPKVVQPLFVDPLERPRFAPADRPAEERALLEADAAAMLAAPVAEVNVLELRSDTEKHRYWQALDARRRAGEQLGESAEAFWRSWQQEDYFRIVAEEDEKFERLLAERRAAMTG